MRRFSQCGVIMVISCFPLFACGGGAGSADVPERHSEAATSGVVITDVCGVLTADLLQDVFDIGDAELSFKPGSSKANPSCKGSWPVPNAEEAKAESAKAMQDYMMAKVAGEKDLGPMPIPHLQHEVRLTFGGKGFKDPAAAQVAFDSLLVSLKEGITAEAEVDGTTHKHTFRIAYDHEVNGVGERAAWAPKLNQLSFVTGRRIIHLTVDVGDAVENERMAVELAQGVIDSLR